LAYSVVSSRNLSEELDLKDQSASFIMRIRPYRTLGNVISGVVITFNNGTEIKQQRDHEQLLMKELQHRTNNLFTVVQAMARQTAKNSESLPNSKPNLVREFMGWAVPTRCSSNATGKAFRLRR
jgi:two-component sensor histidine kinase